MENDNTLRNIMIDNTLKNIRYNAAGYDKIILNLSSAILVMSVIFISEVIKLEDAKYLFLLYISWGFFIFSILFSLAGFYVSNKAHKIALGYWFDYNENSDDNSAENTFPESWWDRLEDPLNLFTGIVFFLAVSITIVFIFSNI